MLAQDGPIYCALMLPFLMRFPSWGLFSLFGRPVRGHIHMLTHTLGLCQHPSSLNCSFFPAATIRRGWLILISMPNDPSQWDYLVSIGTLQPGQQGVWPLVGFIWPLSDVENDREKGMLKDFFCLFLNVWGWPSGGDGGWMRQSRSFRCGGSRH